MHDTHNSRRRAKILRKLARLMTGPAAQSATLRYKSVTWIVIAALVGVHILGFAIVTTQIESRYS